MTNQLTDKQEKFLELIFKPEYLHNYAKAAVDAGYSPNSPIHIIVQGVQKQILERVEMYLATKAPSAAMRIIDVLQSPDMKGAKAALEAATTIMDRVGLSKKERIELEVKAPSGVFILPSKNDK